MCWYNREKDSGKKGFADIIRLLLRGQQIMQFAVPVICLPDKGVLAMIGGKSKRVGAAYHGAAP